MKKISKILCVVLCLAMAMSFALVASAAENETTGFVAADLGYENGDAVADIVGEVITFAFSDGGNSYGNVPKYYTNGTAIRVYSQNTMTVSAAAGYEIVSVTINTDSSKPMNADNTALTNATAAYTDAQTVLTPVDGTQEVVMAYTPGSGHWRFISVYVEYVATDAEEIPDPAGPFDCEIPGTLTYNFANDEAAVAGVTFRWTANADGELGVARMGENFNTTVMINGNYGEIGDYGYVVKVGDVVEITVFGYGAGAVNVPVEFVTAGGQGTAALGTAENPEILTSLSAGVVKTLESGEYFFQYTAAKAGELTIVTEGDGTHNMEVYVNGDTSKIYSNWDNDGEYISIEVAAGDVVTMKVYFDFPGSGTITFSSEFDAGEVPVVPTPSVPTIADGKYVISWNGLTFAALAEDKTYGYPYAGDVNALVDTDYITITNVGNGQFTMQDAYGRYIYMKGTYNSFNVSVEMPTEGYLWTLEQPEGGYLLKNVEKEKYLGYSEQYTSWGCYAEISASSMLTITGETTNPTPDTGDGIFAVLAVLAFSGMGLTMVASKKD